MSIQTIGIGAAANDGTGDELRTGFDKVNDNFLAVAEDIAYVNEIETGVTYDHTDTEILATDYNYVVGCDDTGGAVTLNIPLAFDTWVAFKKLGDANDITITYTGGTIDGVATIKTINNILFVYKSDTNEITIVGGEE